MKREIGLSLGATRPLSGVHGHGVIEAATWIGTVRHG